MSDAIQCPCGSGKDLPSCCGIYHGGTPAPTAIALMRSRYSAFSLGLGQYLYDTLAVDQRKDFDLEEFNASHGETKWMGLEIRQIEDGGLDDETGSVEFVARYKVQKDIIAHHELAEFKRQDGLWVFADCEMNPKQPQRSSAKVGRNDPCVCGSGRKYKKCCGAVA